MGVDALQGKHGEGGLREEREELVGRTAEGQQRSRDGGSILEGKGGENCQKIRRNSCQLPPRTQEGGALPRVPWTGHLGYPIQG